MDPNSALSRMERTMWTVWEFISGTVTRFLRSQPSEIINNEPNTFNEPAVDSKTSKISRPHVGADVDGVSEGQPLDRTHHVHTSSSVAAWENKNIEAFYSCEPDETPRYCEVHVETGQEGSTKDALNEAVNKNNGEEESEEKTVSNVLLDKQKLFHKTTEEIRETEEDGEKEAQDLDQEDKRVKMFRTTDLRPEEMDCALREKLEQHRATQEEKNYEEELKLASTNTYKPNDEPNPAEIFFSTYDEMSDVSNSEVHGQTEVGGTSLVAIQEEISEEENEGREDLKVDEGELINFDNEEVEQVMTDSVFCANNAKQEEPIQDDRSSVVTEVWEEEKNTIQCVPHREETIEHTQIHLMMEKEQIMEERPVNEKWIKENYLEEKNFSSQANNDDCCMEKVRLTSSVTVNPEVETEQEKGGEFKNIPQELIGGRAAVSEELNTQGYEETKEGIPENNKELGPDESPTQSFLKGGNYKEIQITQFPEEEENNDQEGFKNKDTGDYNKEKQDSTRESHHSFEMVFEELGAKPNLSPEELCGPEEVQESKIDSSKSSMKTEIKELDEEFERSHSSSEEIDKRTEEHQNETEVVKTTMDEDHKEPEINKALKVDKEVKFADETLKYSDDEVEKITEVRFCQKSANSTLTEENTSRTSGQQEKMEGRFLNLSLKTEPEFLEISQIQSVVNIEEKESAKEERSADSPQVVGMAAELITGQSGRENTEFELSLHFGKQEISNHSPYRALEMNETEIMDLGSAEGSKTNRPEVFSVVSAEETAQCLTQSERSCTEETSGLTKEPQDVIDEEILDLWIKTATSEDTSEQHTSEPDSQMDKMKDILNEDLDISRQEKFQESNLGKETETSFLPLQSEFLDQSSCDADLSEMQNASLEAEHDMLGAVSEFSEVSVQFVGVQIKQVGEIQMSSSKEERKVSKTESDLEEKHSDLESKNSEGKPDERTETRMGAAVRVFKHREQANLELQIKSSPHVEVEIKKFKEPLEPIRFEQYKEDSEASLVGRSTRDKPWTESDKKMPSLDEADCRHSENISESSSKLRRTMLVEEQATKSDHQNEGNSPALDFAMQRSRIAVKNPRTRPPTNTRSLLQRPSSDPVPSSRLPDKVPIGVPLRSSSIGIKLPGLGGGLPVLKMTQVERDEGNEELSKELLKKEEEKSDVSKQDERQKKPKWMPQAHPGFGNPLMSELKSKLKKTPED